MRYFWWRLADYGTGVFAGGAVVLLISRFLCHGCLGSYTTALLLGIWIGFMLLVNKVFERLRPRAVPPEG